LIILYIIIKKTQGNRAFLFIINSAVYKKSTKKDKKARKNTMQHQICTPAAPCKNKNAAKLEACGVDNSMAERVRIHNRGLSA